MSESFFLKHKKLSIFLIVILVGLASLYNLLHDPFGIRDYKSPDYDPMNYRMWHYSCSGFDMLDAMKVIFPIGSSEDYVDKILVENAGARKEHIESRGNHYRYTRPKLVSPTGSLCNLGATYDDQGKLEQFDVGGAKVYRQSPNNYGEDK